MSAHIRKRLLIVVFSISLLLFFYLIRSSDKKLVTQSRAISKAVVGAPMRLLIPTIDVDANIQYVGVTQGGEMAVPNNTIDVGWFKLGVRPGEKGSSVIAGHFNGKNGTTGVFNSLNKLSIGDKLYIEDNKGKLMTFVVQGSHLYDRGHADDVFNRSDSVYLNLVTCDGIWDEVAKSYNKRLVVFAELVH